MSETPTITNYTSMSNTYNTADGTNWQLTGTVARDAGALYAHAHDRRIGAIAHQTLANMETQVNPTKPKRRIVRVFIVDPDERVPLDKCVLFEGEQHLTDATDQELFFETPIAERLKAHNEERQATKDEAASERTGHPVFLKPARIRDLVMTVVTVAEFS